MFLRSTLSLLLVASLAGCAAESSSEGDSESLVASSDDALSAFGKLLVGDYKSAAPHPTFSLEKDSGYAWDTGIRCITTPCPSGDAGGFSIWRDYAGRRYVRLLSNDGKITRWFRVDSLKPVTLVGVFGTTGTFKLTTGAPPGCTATSECAAGEQCLSSACTPRPSCAQVTAPDGKFYARNFAAGAYAEADAWAAKLAAGSSYSISLSTCSDVAAGFGCPEDYTPVCAFLSGTDAAKTFENACSMRVATIAAAGTVSDAVSVSTKGFCTTGVARCSTYTLGTDASFAYYVHDFGSQFEADAWIALNQSVLSSRVWPGKCASFQGCTKEGQAFCGGVRSEPARNFGNRCMFEASVRADSATGGWSKGYAALGECAP